MLKNYLCLKLIFFPEFLIIKTVTSITVLDFVQLSKRKKMSKKHLNGKIFKSDLLFQIL